MPRDSIYLQKWYAEEYDKDRFGGEFGNYLEAQEVRTFLSLTDGCTGRVLDAGSGTGKLAIALMQKSREVIAIDSSEEMLRIGRGKADKETMKLRSAICDVHNLCFRENTFECVISSRLLMHLNHWRKGLSELCRVARGIVIVDFPPLRGFIGLDSTLKRCKKFFSSNTKAYRAFLMSSIAKELQKHHFRIVVVKKQFSLPIAFHRWLNRPWLSLKIEKSCRILGLTWLLGAPVTLKAVKNGYTEGHKGTNMC